MSTPIENELALNKCALMHHNSEQHNDLLETVFGTVYKSTEDRPVTSLKEPTVFICGNLATCKYVPRPFQDVYIIRDLTETKDMPACFRDAGHIHSDQVPRNIHGAGVYFRNLFPDQDDYFYQLQSVHAMQELTESNKPGVSFRKGIYLSHILEKEQEKEFHLLRCSTNLGGPTESFHPDVDLPILRRVQTAVNQCFAEHTTLNHVLAQVYENKMFDTREKKAKIKAHSDKTKDMPDQGVIAFCTFYSDDIRKYGADKDWKFKKATSLTSLRFVPKSNDLDLKSFDVPLLPNSVLIIPLSTNRMYTHATVPPNLAIKDIPTRLGYVIRCSKTLATHCNGTTYINGTAMTQPSEENVQEIKRLYKEENLTTEKIKYKSMYFSLNNGDYKEPIVVNTLI